MTSPTHAAPAPAANRTPRQPISGNFAEVELPLVCTKRELAAVLCCTTKHIDNLTALEEARHV